jgi:hypothetical protein
VEDVGKVSICDQLYIFDPQYRITESTFVAPRNDPMRFYTKKPAVRTGLWTSSYIDGTSDWVRWCIGENFDDPEHMSWLVLTPAEDVRLFEIDSHRDLMRLIKEYPHLPPESWGSYLTSLLDYTSIDFERMCVDGYDGIHLTEKGNDEVHLSFPVNMNGWDVESTVWFRWCFVAEREVKPLVCSCHEDSK